MITSPFLVSIGVSGEPIVTDESELFILALSARLAFDPTLDRLFLFISINSTGFDDRNSVTMIMFIGTVIAAETSAT